MGNRNTTPTEIFSYAVIAVSLATMSGLALGHATEQAMHPRLAANSPADPVERYALGQNAYDTTNRPVRSVRSQPAEFADASYEIGRYENGARILTPAEPARKIERLRLERLQDWNEEAFGAADGLVDADAERADNDYAPIDVGAVMDAPESQSVHAVTQIRTSVSGA